VRGECTEFTVTFNIRLIHTDIPCGGYTAVVVASRRQERHIVVSNLQDQFHTAATTARVNVGNQDDNTEPVFISLIQEPRYLLITK